VGFRRATAGSLSFPSTAKSGSAKLTAEQIRPIYLRGIPARSCAPIALNPRESHQRIAHNVAPVLSDPIDASCNSIRASARKHLEVGGLISPSGSSKDGRDLRFLRPHRLGSSSTQHAQSPGISAHTHRQVTSSRHAHVRRPYTLQAPGDDNCPAGRWPHQFKSQLVGPAARDKQVQKLQTAGERALRAGGLLPHGNRPTPQASSLLVRKSSARPTEPLVSKTVPRNGRIIATRDC
jgi:hypothetical protein